MTKKTPLLGFGFLIAVAVIAGGYVLFSGEKKPVSNTTAPAAPTRSPEISPNSQNSEMVEIQVAGSEYSFVPAALEIKEGQKVRLTFKNTGGLPHDLAIDELGVKSKTIAPGKSEVIEFTANKSGSFAMYCSVGTHRVQGMEGKVEVN